MKKKIALISIFVIWSAASLAKTTDKQKDDAVKSAISVAKKHWSKITSLSVDCVKFLVPQDEYAKATKQIKIDIHERHNEKCGGSPMTEPRITTLTAEIATGKVSYENVPGEKIPLN